MRFGGVEMKVFMDDQRDAPEGWTLARDTDEVVRLLKTGEVTELSLDYHMGVGDANGMDVLGYIEHWVYAGEMENLPTMKPHTSDGIHAVRMKQRINRIKEKHHLRYNVVIKSKKIV